MTPERSKVRRVYLVVHDMEIRIKPSTSYPLYFDSTGNRKLLQSDLSFACLLAESFSKVENGLYGILVDTAKEISEST